MTSQSRLVDDETASEYPDLDREMIARMVRFSSRLEEEVVVKRKWGQSELLGSST